MKGGWFIETNHQVSRCFWSYKSLCVCLCGYKPLNQQLKQTEVHSGSLKKNSFI